MTVETVGTFAGMFAGGALVVWKMGPSKLRAILSEALAVHRAQEVEDVKEAVRTELKDLVRETVRAEMAGPNERISKLEGSVQTLQAIAAGHTPEKRVES
jgi:hypothetical protein